MGHSYIQIPPDSTGKKIRHSARIDLEIINLTEDFNQFERGDAVVGKTSGATAVFMDYQVELDETYLFLKEGLGTFVSGEIIEIAGLDAAEVDDFELQHTANMVMTDPDNPLHRSKVDNFGSQFVRYSEGDLGFDAFGHAQFSQTSQMESHTFLYGDNPDKYWDQELNNGTIEAAPSQSCMVFAVDNSSGSLCSRTTHQYYPYQPGVGNELQISIRNGDEGKAGLVRRWGLFDDQDGIFFEQNGTDNYAVVRSTMDGVTTEERVHNDDVNGDSLDDINNSEYVIDTTKYNLYWIDYQWLGVGKVRMGTFSPSGKRITVHTFQNPNAKILPWAKRGTLPVRVEQYNTATTSGVSEMRLVCAAINRQAAEVIFQGNVYSQHSSRITVSGSNEVPLVSAKPNLLHNGQTNRITMVPTDLECVVEGDPIEVHFVVNAGITGATYAISASDDSAYVLDRDGTAIAGGTVRDRVYFQTGVTQRILEENLVNSVKIHASGLVQPIFSLSAKCINPAGNAVVTMLVRWKEVQ
jgi:hypothetical protein